MFYAQFVLSKKGPLAKIWLAAHWEKKLTKAQVFETNIDKAVESILEPKVKMALRTTGHLLLGIVRIYSRKAKYLLADCNEAFLKIKMAFRPGVVDLPEEGREASLNAITLPEVFHDFDSALPDFSDIDYQHQLTLNQSRIEDITLKEDLPTTSRNFQAHDDEFGDGGFDDNEFSRETGRDASSFHGRASIDDLRHDKSSKLADIDLNAPILDDGFGGELDPSLLDAELNGALFGETDNLDLHVGEDMDFETTVVGSEINSNAPKSPAKAAQFGQAESTITSTSNEQTTLIPNEEEAFALEPLDATVFHGQEKHKTKRRRKLIVDEIKSISGEDMKQQLADSSDTTTSLDLAPPTKKLMHFREAGGIDKLFVLPGMDMPSKALLKMFSKNLVSKPREEDQPNQDDDTMQVDEVEQTRGRDSNLITGRSSLVSIVEEVPSNLPEPDAQMPEVNLPLINEESEHQSHSVSAAHVSPWDNPETPGDSLVNDDVPFVTEPKSPTRQSRTPAAHQSPRRSAPKEKISKVVEEEEEDETEDSEEAVAKWNKRTQTFLNTLQKQWKSEDYLGFMDLTKGKTRKQAAQSFYNVLVLRKWEYVDVEQVDPYGDIILTKGRAIGET